MAEVILRCWRGRSCSSHRWSLSLPGAVRKKEAQIFRAPAHKPGHCPATALCFLPTSRGSVLNDRIPCRNNQQLNPSHSDVHQSHFLSFRLFPQRCQAADHRKIPFLSLFLCGPPLWTTLNFSIDFLSRSKLIIPNRKNTKALKS